MPFIAQQSYKIDLTPQGGYVMVYVSQHDNEAREIVFKIYNQGQVFDIPANINVSVQGVKSNGGYFTHNCTYSGNLVTMSITDDMTDVIGKAVCVLKFANASEEKLATAKFILNVDSDSSSEGIIIDTVAEEIFDQLMDEIRAQAAAININIATLQSMVGTPLIAATAAGMTDHNKIYVYTGDETGYTYGNWYYWDGTEWQSGGQYNSVPIVVDQTPISGSINPVSSNGVYTALGNKVDKDEKGLLSTEAKRALLACFDNVIWKTADGAIYVDELRVALEASDRRPELPSIYEQVEFIKGSGTQYINTGILSQIPFRAEAKISYSRTETRVLSGTASTVGNTRFYLFGYGYFGNGNRIGSRFGDNVWMFDSNFVPSIDTPYELSSGINHAANNKASIFITGEGMSASATINVPTVGNPITIMKFVGESECALGVAIYEIRLYSSDTLLFDGIPCYRKSDGKTGLFDAVTNQFFANSGTGEFILGDIVK